jgi:TP901 family phage tail tape measure protein
MQSSGIDVRNLSSEQRRLRQATTDASRALEQQKQKLAALAEQQRRMSAARAAYDRTRATQGAMASTGAGLMATGAAVGALTLKPVVDYAQAEDAATGLKVSMMGAGGVVHKEFAAISDLATKLGNQLPGTTADFQNMMSTLIQQGMSAKSILGGLGQATAYLGVQMKMPYDQAAQFAAKLQDATGTAEKDMMGLMDTIQRSYYLGVDSSNMLGAFTNLSPALSILRKKGLEASQVLAPLIVMADQAGMSGDAAGNAYRKIFQMSMDAGNVADANKGALKGTGIALQFSDGKGEFAGLDNLFTQLAKMRKLTTEQRLETLKGIYGDDAETLQALNLMIDKGQDGYNETIKKMKAQADLQSRVNTQLGTLKNLWDAATGTFTNALVAFGEAVAPEVKALVTWIGELSERLGSWSKANPVLSNRLMKTVAAIAAVTAGAGALALGIAAVLGPFAMMRFSVSALGIRLPAMASAFTTMLAPLKALTVGVWQLSAALLTNPMTWIVLGIAAAVAVAAALIYKYWAPIKAFMVGVIDGLSESFAPIKTMFTALSPLFDAIGSGLKSLFGWFSKLIEPVKYTSSELAAAGDMGRKFGMLMSFGIKLVFLPIKLLIDGIGLLYRGVQSLSPWVTKFWGGIKTMASQGFAWLKIAFSWSPLGIVVNNWGAITGWASSFWTDLTALASQGFTWLKIAFSWSPLGLVINNWGAITAYFSSVANQLKGFGEKFGEYLTDGINKVLAPLTVLMDGIQWVLDNIRKLPRMGEGAANHAQAMGNNPALASGYLTGNYGPSATAGGFNYVTGGYTPAEAKPYQPVRMSSQTTVVDNTLHAPITVHAAPGMDEAKVGQMVEAKLQVAQQRQAARSRARLGDRD